ncbi:TolC family protein [Lysobacter sp. CA199]|uniref:TolC family protein n=1 Tax=Lysobacter sp. CA199 TaxID=3455608 RepID=UPI003F8D348D
MKNPIGSTPRFLLRTGPVSLALAFCLNAAAQERAANEPVSLGELFAIARESEPNVRASAANAQAADARTRQAFGAMLPQLSVSANRNRNRRRYETEGRLPSTTRDRYDNDSAQLTLNLPLWRPANHAALRQSREAGQQAEFQLEDAEQQLYLKLATVWFELMETRDAAEFTAAQRDALKARWDIALSGVRHGQASPPEAEEARGKYESANADAESAKLDHDTKLAELEQWLGPAEELIQPYLRDDASIPDTLGGDTDAWLEQIDSHSPAVRAARRAVRVAEEEVGKQRAGHQPTLDLVASYGNNTQDVGNFPGQSGYDIKQWNVGVQLNVPLYSGGTISAKVSEARAMLDKALAEAEATRRLATVNVKSARLSWLAGQSKANAARIGVSAGQLALTAAERGLARGLAVQADVLDARQKIATSLRDLRKARYQQLVASLKLRATLGQLGAADIEELDDLFAPQPQAPVSASAPALAGQRIARAEPAR